jgi:type III pantothenate kinase
MTILLVDAGNTRVKWAVAREGSLPAEWIAEGAVVHAELDSLESAWSGHAITRALVANVAGAAMHERLRALLLRLWPTLQPAWFSAQAELAGLRNRYRNPTQLGADRFAAALGARTLHPGKALVVATCGTATTVDGVSASGEFVGGMILPGLGLMLASLARGTAQLPEASADAPLPPSFADNTLDAIRSGCVSAQAGAIERACAALPAELCIVSGGAAPHVAPALSVPHRMLHNIVLVGLHAAAIAPASS